MPRRRPDRATQEAAGLDPGRHRRGPPGPPVGRGRGRAARRAAGQPLRRRPRGAAPELKREGTELYYELDVSIAQAALGHARPVPTVDGDEEIEIKPGTQPGTELRLRGKGVPHLRRTGVEGRPPRLRPGHRPEQAHARSSGRPSRRTRGVGRGRRPGRARRDHRSRPRQARLRRASSHDPRTASETRDRDRHSPRRRHVRRGAWIELAVEADLEAVEAVSEILGRYAPGGTSVEPGFVLVEDGLAADRRFDPAGHRPRPTCPAAIRGPSEAAIAGARRRPSATSRRSACGPSATSTTRVVHEADWATGVEGASSRSSASAGASSSGRPGAATAAPPGEVVLALDPGMAFGTGLHPTTRLCLEGLERLADGGRLAARTRRRDGSARVLDVGIGSGILAIAAGLLGAGELVGVDPDPIAVDASVGQCRPQPAGGPARRPRGERPAVGVGPFDVVLRQSHRVAARRPRPGAPRRAAAGRHAPRVGHLRRPRSRRSATAFAAVGLRVVDRLVRSASGSPSPPSATAAIRASADARSRAGAATIGRDVPASPSSSSSTSRWRSASSCRRSCCRSRSGRARADRTAHLGRVTAGLLAMQGTGTLVIGAGTRRHRSPPRLVARAHAAPAAVAPRRPGDLRGRTSPSPSSSSDRTCAGSWAGSWRPDDRAWAALARRQRYVSYAMAGLIGAIGWLMSTKPALW